MTSRSWLYSVSCNFFIDSGTPFDGMYCNNDQTGGPHYDWDAEKRTPGTFFISQVQYKKSVALFIFSIIFGKYGNIITFLY